MILQTLVILLGLLSWNADGARGVMGKALVALGLIGLTFSLRRLVARASQQRTASTDRFVPPGEPPADPPPSPPTGLP